jgi:tetratricopeptide (TPR) repeat protein
MNQSDSSQAILHYDKGAALGRQGAFAASIAEFEKALNCSPEADLELVICYNLAVSIQKHYRVSPADLPTFEVDEEEDKQTARIIELCDRVISLYHRYFESGKIITDLPVKHFYQQAATLRLRTQSLQPKKKGGASLRRLFTAPTTHPQVETLRLYRDTQLLPSRLGRFAVGLYYRVAPPIADVVSRSLLLTKSVRIT